MKTIILSLTILLIAIKLSGQIKNVIEVSKTTKDSEGEKQSVKK